MMTRAKSRKAVIKQMFLTRGGPSSSWTYEKIIAWVPHKNIRVRRPRTLSVCRLENVVYRIVRYPADNFESF